MVLRARGCEVVGLAADGREAVDVVRRHRARRRADGHPDAGAGRDRRHRGDHRGRARRPGCWSSRRTTWTATSTRACRRVRPGSCSRRPPDRLVDGIGTVAAGESLLAPALTRRLIEEHVRRPAPADGRARRLRALTEREREVFALIARGLSNTRSPRAGVSEATVKTHVNRILAKLGRDPGAARGARLRKRADPPRRTRHDPHLTAPGRPRRVTAIFFTAICAIRLTMTSCPLRAAISTRMLAARLRPCPSGCGPPPVLSRAYEPKHSRRAVIRRLAGAAPARRETPVRLAFRMASSAEPTISRAGASEWWLAMSPHAASHYRQ